MQRIVKAGLIGLGVAGLGMLLELSPWGGALEERLGLAALFRMRGPLAPPAEVAVVSLDRASAERLGLPEQIRDWPRSVYARLIERLVEAGASVIVFDLILEKPQDPAEDRALAEAVADARRVVLFEYLDAVRRPLAEGGGPASEWLTTERAIGPLPSLVEGAVGIAPFPLPKVPSRISQFWTFQQVAGERPTLPVVALQQHAMPAWRAWAALLREQARGRLEPLPDGRAGVGGAQAWRQLMVATHHAFQDDPSLADRLAARVRATVAEPRERRLLEALIGLYGGADSRYLNFYGPAGHVATVPLYHLLRPGTGRAQALPDLAGRAAFVGQSELDSHLGDDFSTVFSRADGVDLSGVEIAATAFANLLDGRTVRAAGAASRMALLGGFGLAVGLMAGLLPGVTAVTLCLALAATWYAGAQIAFMRADLWLPVTIPLLVQLPLGLLAGLTVQYRDAQRARVHLDQGLRSFLDDKVASRLAEPSFDPASFQEHVQAICLMTDIEGFTSLAEAMSPQALKPLLDRYMAIVVSSVERHGGSRTDMAGDGNTCVWRAPLLEPGERLRACTAALEIERTIAAFNDRHGPPGRPTRVGLHAGWIVLGSVGGAGRFAYSAVGDAVNAASRIEQLNKQLGTYVLASDIVTDGLDALRIRPLGRFQVIGKEEVLRLGEVRGFAGEPDDGDLLARFAEALAWFEDRRWQEAGRAFAALLDDHPADGPARFYLDRCGRCLGDAARPAAPAVIRLERK